MKVVGTVNQKLMYMRVTEDNKNVRVMANADPHTLFQWSLSYLQLSFFLFSIHGHFI